METALINWSRLQFAMTAAYHWLFVPLTLGLSMIMAFMETLYVIKKDVFWKKLSQFWMKLFAINFAVGIATGLILEFQFGTNWSNYAWFVGDIFGAPLAIEGILAFFMEATFFAVMFFGWEKVSPRFHLTSTWLCGIGAAISAYWILVANSWMQHPVGTTFNPDTLRSEMTDFWAVVTNPVAVSKFFHSVFSGWMTGAIFALGVGCWFLLKRRDQKAALASMAVACGVGLLGGAATLLSGDSSGIHVAKYQPMKLAAAEGLQRGGPKAPFSLVPGVEIPGLLSLLATHSVDGYVPGIQDIIDGYAYESADKAVTEPSVEEKMARGKTALSALEDYRRLRETAPEQAARALDTFRSHEAYLGYGYLNKAEDVVPPVRLVYWAFRIMVGLGTFLMLLMAAVAFFLYKKRMQDLRWLQWVGLLSIPLVYLCGQAGWIVAEVGRQPWTIQGLLPVNVAASGVRVGAVQTTFFLFLAVFALFLAIEIRIMLKAIAQGPQTH